MIVDADVQNRTYSSQWGKIRGQTTLKQVALAQRAEMVHALFLPNHWASRVPLAACGSVVMPRLSWVPAGATCNPAEVLPQGACTNDVATFPAPWETTSLKDMAGLSSNVYNQTGCSVSMCFSDGCDSLWHWNDWTGVSKQRLTWLGV